MNILLLDVDIRGRIEAIGHCSKALILDKTFQGWQREGLGVKSGWMRYCGA